MIPCDVPRRIRGDEAASVMSLDDAASHLTSLQVSYQDGGEGVGEVCSVGFTRGIALNIYELRMLAEHLYIYREREILWQRLN